MIKRTYFFKVESLQKIQAERRSLGKITCCTAFISYRSWFPVDNNILFEWIMNKAESKENDFIRGEIILTSISKL